MYSPQILSPLLDRLHAGELTCEQALKLLVVKGTIDLTQLDPNLQQQFFRSLRDRNHLPPIVPLLFWQHCYYLGSPVVLSESTVQEMRQQLLESTIEMQILPISPKSFHDWRQYQQALEFNSNQASKLSNSNKTATRKTSIKLSPQLSLTEPEGQVRWIKDIIASASEKRASDIHLEPCHEGLKVKFRIDGILHHLLTINADVGRRLIVALKVMCDMDIAESRCPQDGRIGEKYAIGDRIQGLDLRVSLIPVVSPKRGEPTEKAVMRLLQQKITFPTLAELGFSEQTQRAYERMLDQPQGIIIITGPTGSGKSNTLCASLQAINREGVNIATLEDPIEQMLQDVNQTQVNEKAGMTFVAGLRAILRQDPDIIMVGEVRDRETADIAVRAALTGHLVLTTLHTNDAIRTIPRLRDIGLDPGLISDALLGVVAQRLVRKVCPHCAEPYTPTEYELKLLGLNLEESNSQAWRKGRGCPQCLNSGYLGREAVIELLNVDDTVRQLIYEGTIAQLNRYLDEINFDSFRKAAVHKITNGMTTLEEIKRVLPHSALSRKPSQET